MRALLVLTFLALAACGKPPTEEENRRAIQNYCASQANWEVTCCGGVTAETKESCKDYINFN